MWYNASCMNNHQKKTWDRPKFFKSEQQQTWREQNSCQGCTNTYQTGDGHGWPVGSAHEEPPQDHLVEGGIRTTGQEPVQLNTPGGY